MVLDTRLGQTLEMVLDTSLLNTQQYKVRIKGKVEQSRESSSALPRHPGVVAIEKGAFGSSSTKGHQLIYPCFTRQLESWPLGFWLFKNELKDDILFYKVAWSDWSESEVV